MQRPDFRDRTMTLFRTLAAALVVAGCAGAAFAQQSAADAVRKQTRLERIAATGQFVIGVREDAFPFAFLDDQHKAAGYSVEIAQAIAAEVKQRLGRPDLVVRYNAVTPATRFPLVVNGVVDIECGATANTSARQKTVAFSNTIFVSSTKVAVPAQSGAGDLAALQGRRIAVVADSATEARLRALDANRSLSLKLVPARNDLRAFQTLERGDADAFAAAEALLAAQMARAGRAAAFRVIGTPLAQEAFGCILPADAPGLKQIADDTIARLMASGELAKIYERWFLQPLGRDRPPLGLPMSAELRALIAAPNDRPIE
jgi:glutamate/aspartate transport system substrate-binding protein